MDNLLKAIDIFFNGRDLPMDLPKFIDNGRDGTDKRVVLQKQKYPKFDVFEKNDTLVFRTELAGMTKNQIKIEVLNDKFLSISGEKNTNTEIEDKAYHIRELKHSTFRRTFTLPSWADSQNVTSSFSNGILEIVFNKRPLKQDTTSKREITIK